MSTHKLTAALSIFAVNFSCLAAGPNLGKPIDAAEIAAWDISILPDGTGLPPGSGTPAQGAPIYAQKCAACHGENGKGAANAAVVGGAALTNGIDTVKTIANFWPYSTTLFDFIRRAFPTRYTQAGRAPCRPGVRRARLAMRFGAKLARYSATLFQQQGEGL